MNSKLLKQCVREYLDGKLTTTLAMSIVTLIVAKSNKKPTPADIAWAEKAYDEFKERHGH